MTPGNANRYSQHRKTQYQLPFWPPCGRFGKRQNTAQRIGSRINVVFYIVSVQVSGPFGLGEKHGRQPENQQRGCCTTAACFRNGLAGDDRRADTCLAPLSAGSFRFLSSLCRMKLGIQHHAPPKQDAQEKRKTENEKTIITESMTAFSPLIESQHRLDIVYIISRGGEKRAHIPRRKEFRITIPLKKNDYCTLRQWEEKACVFVSSIANNKQKHDSQLLKWRYIYQMWYRRRKG